MYFRVYYVPMGETFYDNYDDDDFDLIVMDEYEGQKPITWVNSFVDGSTVTLRVKGGQVCKRNNLPVICLCNDSPSAFYHKSRAQSPNSFDAFMRRWEVVVLDISVDLFAVIDWLGQVADHEAVRDTVS